MPPRPHGAYTRARAVATLGLRDHVIQPIIPTVVPPEALYRGSLGKEPWEFDTPRRAFVAYLEAHASREVALLQVLGRLPAFAAVLAVDDAERAARSRHQLRRRSVLDLSREVEDPRVGHIVVAAMKPQGVFYDLRDPEDVRELRFELSMERVFHDVLRFEIAPDDLVTDGLRRILAETEVDGVRCGGYLQRQGRDGLEVWHVFPAGLGQVFPQEVLDGSDAQTYVTLSQAATSAGLATPVRPSGKVARELLAEALTPEAYGQSADSVDVFDLDAGEGFRPDGD